MIFLTVTIFVNFLLTSDAGVTVNIENLLLNQVDLVGDIVKIQNSVLITLTNKMQTPENDSCIPHILTFEGFDFIVSQQPIGYCTFCCPLKNPARYVRFYFTNKIKYGKFVRIKFGNKPSVLRSIGVDNKLQTVIYIHGFTEHGRGVSARHIRDAYLNINENYNIIMVDWKELATFPWYYQAVDNTRHVGAVLAKFLKFYNATGELPLSKVHLVGFSLGGQVAGFTGKLLKGKLTRITALDPAFPLFPLNDLSGRLSKSDAYYVDVIHTNAGFFGFPISIGHADFYPNGGGLTQPGCEISKLSERKTIQLFGTCAHLRAWSYFAESVINPKAFPATKCGILEKDAFKNCRFTLDAYMGFPAKKSTTLGNFYLTTNDQPPFSKSMKKQEHDIKPINLVLDF